MIPKFIFVIVFAIVLNESQARPGLKSGLMRCYYDCTADPTLIADVNVILQDGFKQYPSNTCRVAQYAADALKSYRGGEWVILIGAHGVIGNRERFAVQFDRVVNTYLVASYKGTHDILVVKPLCEQPNLLQGKGNGGSARDLTQINTTMADSLKRQLQYYVNNIFEDSNGDYQQTANQVLNTIKNICGGKWFVLVGPEHVLTNSGELCGVAKKYEKSSFNATYEYRNSINIFAPLCN